MKYNYLLPHVWWTTFLALNTANSSATIRCIFRSTCWKIHWACKIPLVDGVDVDLRSRSWWDCGSWLVACRKDSSCGWKHRVNDVGRNPGVKFIAAFSDAVQFSVRSVHPFFWSFSLLSLQVNTTSLVRPRLFARLFAGHFPPFYSGYIHCVPYQRLVYSPVNHAYDIKWSLTADAGAISLRIVACQRRLPPFGPIKPLRLR